VTENDTLYGGELVAAAELVDRSQKIAIFSHVNPDGDSIGVGLGLKRGLTTLDREVDFVISDPVPEMFQYLPDWETIKYELPRSHYDLMLVADCGDIHRVGKIYHDNEERFLATPILNLDHHDSNTRFGHVNYVDENAASSSELAFRLLELLGAAIDKHTATDLLTGILNDTGSFQHSNTDDKVLQIASELRRRGADLELAASEMFRAKKLSTAKLWALILSTLHLDVKRRIVWAHMTPEMLKKAGATSDESEGVVDEMSGIREAKLAAFLKEKDVGTVRVSLRSHGIDCSRICAAFGGGGHIRASGATINANIADAERLITEVFDELCETGSLES
jgi:bifunctional oligoribonuclease and PAP phosphatase NrnA